MELILPVESPGPCTLIDVKALPVNEPSPTAPCKNRDKPSPPPRPDSGLMSSPPKLKMVGKPSSIVVCSSRYMSPAVIVCLPITLVILSENV